MSCEDDIEWLKAVLKVRDAELELCRLERNQARKEARDGGSKEGCARCSAEAHAAMAAPDGGASVTDPSKPTKPLRAESSEADLRKRMGHLVERLCNEVCVRAGVNGMKTFGEQMAYKAAADMLEKELAK